MDNSNMGFSIIHESNNDGSMDLKIGTLTIIYFLLLHLEVYIYTYG